jgi:hypothetical protein
MQILIILALAGLAQVPETRGIVPEQVVQARPQPKSAAQVAKKPKYQPDAPLTSQGRQVGVTIWRLRAASASDAGARILVQENENTVEWVPERVGSGSNLREGDRVRLSIESPDTGYLYVIDRERYASGERGPAYLIFPTSRTHAGDNKVSGGKLIDIPAQDDRPNFFTLRNSRKDQTEEELTVLLTREPLSGVQIGEKALALSNSQIEQWEHQWGTSKIERFELTGGAGRTWTKAEQEAAANATRVLTQEDPPPQTVYRVATKSGEPLLVKVHLRYSTPAR